MAFWGRRGPLSRGRPRFFTPDIDFSPQIDFVSLFWTTFLCVFIFELVFVSGRDLLAGLTVFPGVSK